MLVWLEAAQKNEGEGRETVCRFGAGALLPPSSCHLPLQTAAASKKNLWRPAEAKKTCGDKKSWSSSSGGRRWSSFKGGGAITAAVSCTHEERRRKKTEEGSKRLTGGRHAKKGGGGKIHDIKSEKERKRYNI